MPSVATRRWDTKAPSTLKRNTPGRWPIEQPHTCPPQGVHSMFWNIVGAGMFIGGVAGAFFYEGPLFWGKVGIAVVGIVLALIFQRVGDRLLGHLRAQ